MMNRLTCVFVVLLILFGSCTVDGNKYEGDVIAVNLEEKTLVLQQNDGEKINLKVGANARLYYNNIKADLAMYAPITDSDFLSGYLLTDQSGIVKEASFYYLVREGIILQVEDENLVFEELDCGISATYPLLNNVQVLFNNLAAELADVQQGMRALIFFNHDFHVRKIAIFHYDYLGFVEQINLDERTIILNIGSRLKPELHTFELAQDLTENGLHWDKININLENNRFLVAKVIIQREPNLVGFIDIRAL